MNTTDSRNEKEVVTDMAAPVYTLAVTSELSGIPAHSIRQYIDRGLLLPHKRASGRHLFSQRDISRLQHIRRMMNERGLNIAGIRALMAMLPCWAIRECRIEECLSCPALYNDRVPCWEASSKGSSCRNRSCRGCKVYGVMNGPFNLKRVLGDVIR